MDHEEPCLLKDCPPAGIQGSRLGHNFQITRQYSYILNLLSPPPGSGVHKVRKHTLPSPGQTRRGSGSCGCAQRAQVDL